MGSQNYAEERQEALTRLMNPEYARQQTNIECAERKGRREAAEVHALREKTKDKKLEELLYLLGDAKILLGQLLWVVPDDIGADMLHEDDPKNYFVEEMAKLRLEIMDKVPRLAITKAHEATAAITAFVGGDNIPKESWTRVPSRGLYQVDSRMPADQWIAEWNEIYENGPDEDFLDPFKNIVGLQEEDKIKLREEFGAPKQS